MTAKNKILVTGITGQVGNEIYSTLSALNSFDVYGTKRAQPLEQKINNILPMDLTKPGQIRNTIAQIKPDIIINTAAYTQVDKAEEEQETATKINAIAPKILAEEAKSINALLIHFSTDYVFNGSGERFRNEEQETDPINIYGKSKLLGEQNIKEIDGSYIIMRTSWVFSDHGHNFVKTMLRLGSEREKLQIVSDQIGAPTSSKEICRGTLQIIKLFKEKGPRWLNEQKGVYHFACKGETSWFEFAKEIFKIAGQLRFPLKIDDIQPQLSEAYPTPAKRPLNSRLDCNKFEKTFSFKINKWQDCLLDMMNKLRQNKG